MKSRYGSLGGVSPPCDNSDIQQMKYVIVEITNENEMLEANVSASESGLRSGKPSFHLMLGPSLSKEIVLTPAEVLRRIGWAVAEQLQDEEETIRREAEGARSLILELEDEGQVILRFDIGITKADAVNALIDGGLDHLGQRRGKYSST